MPPSSWTTLVSADHPDPTRHLYIHHQTQSIKGSFSISPLAEDVYPPLYDMPLEATTKNHSASATFSTKNSAIGVTVWITGKDPLIREKAHHGKPKGKPVSVEAKSTMGHMKLVIVSESTTHNNESIVPDTEFKASIRQPAASTYIRQITHWQCPHSYPAYLFRTSKVDLRKRQVQSFRRCSCSIHTSWRAKEASRCWQDSSCRLGVGQVGKGRLYRAQYHQRRHQCV